MELIETTIMSDSNRPSLYAVCIDPESGKFYEVNRTSKEMEPVDIVAVKHGTKLLSDRQIKARREYAQQKEKEDLLERTNYNHERFTFINLEEKFADINLATVTRLIYLSTYSGYDGRLMINKRKPMKLSDLPEVLKLSERAAYNFWSEVKNRYIVDDETSLRFINDSVFRRGRLEGNTQATWIKSFESGVRSLYEACDPKQHKTLGYVFMMLSYLNIERNVLCLNPYAHDHIQVLSFNQFCDCIGYGRKHADRLFNEIMSLEFTIDGKQEPFCSYFGVASRKNRGRPIKLLDSAILVNPKVVYRGKGIPAKSIFELAPMTDEEATAAIYEAPQKKLDVNFPLLVQ